MPDNGEIMRYEEVRELELSLQRLQEIDDLSLNRHVQCRHGFVENQKPWVKRDGAGDADALSLAARELVWVPIRVLGGQADQVEKLGDTLSVRGLAMEPQRLGDDPLDSHARVQ